MGHLLNTDVLTKPAAPESNDKENNVKFKRQEIIFTATPPPIKRVLQPDSSEPVKPQKQFKRSTEAEKVNGERIPVRKTRTIGLLIRKHQKLWIKSSSNKLRSKMQRNYSKRGFKQLVFEGTF